MEIFVFGSNKAGRHGKGAALTALTSFGAKYGQGEGLQGNSYAVPTKDRNLRTLELSQIRFHIAVFKEFAREHPELKFRVTKIGCGLAGYGVKDIAPFFKDSPANCKLPFEFEEYLKGEKEHGTTRT